MNRFRLLCLLLLCAATGGEVEGQGLLHFSTLTGQRNKVTVLGGGTPEGPDYVVDIEVFNPLTSQFDSTLLAANGTPFLPTPLLTGDDAGLFAGGILTVPNFPAGVETTFRVWAWDRRTGTTFNTATARGNALFTVPLGGKTGSETLPAAEMRFAGIVIAPKSYTESATSHVHRDRSGVYLVFPYHGEYSSGREGTYRIVHVLATYADIRNPDAAPSYKEIIFGPDIRLTPIYDPVYHVMIGEDAFFKLDTAEAPNRFFQVVVRYIRD